MSTISLSWPAPDVALLTFDQPGRSANILNSAVLDELDALLDDLTARDDLAGVILRSGKPGSFCVGADIGEFHACRDQSDEATVRMCRRGQRLFDRLATLPAVTVAAIDGVCVGGGTEMALACDVRLMTDASRSRIGLPEVTIGIIPGWGGTVRLPRLIGLDAAARLISSGELIDAEAALALGMVDHLTTPERLVDAALAVVEREREAKGYVSRRQTRQQPIALPAAELELMAHAARTRVDERTNGRYPAPNTALEVLFATAGKDINAACQLEAEGVARLFGRPEQRALLNVFFLTDRNKHDRGVDDAAIDTHAIGQVGVVGAGIMGASIAAVNLKSRLPVKMIDADDAALQHGVRTALDEASYDRAAGCADAQRAAELAPLLSACHAEQELSGCPLVVESIIERFDVKQDVLTRLESTLADDVILATNTSTIPIARLAERLRRPQRFCGMHFFNPVPKMKLVEVVRGPATDDRTVATVVAHAKRTGKMPIVVHDAPGFLVNRLLHPYLSEALELLGQGVSIEAIDRAAVTFGMPIGPIALYDLIGLDTSYYAGKVMWGAFPDRTTTSPVLPALVKAGRLGRKTGRGFYSYENKRHTAEVDPALDAIVEPYVGGRREFTDDALTDRLILPMLLEATRLLDEHVVRDVRDVDLGMIFGLGFPRFRGGLLYWADTLGAAKVVERLNPLAEEADRYQPTPLLQQTAAANATFYPADERPTGNTASST